MNDTSRDTALDPITFEVVKNALSSTADEMALIIMRSAYSPVVRDSMDYSTALCDRNGEVVAQGLTLAVQLGSFPDCMRILMKDHAPTAQPGDVFLFNDPYGSGGQHLPDMYVIKPLFYEGAIEAWACTMAHHCDVGGITPGSSALHATEIFQEGLCIPVVKLHEAGVPNETLLRIIAKNTRMPVQVIGDLKAQLAACAAGERGYLDLLRRHGAVQLRRYLHALQEQAERLMRKVISDIPDGRYSFVDFIDGVGEDPQPLKIAVEITVEGERITVDFEGTSGQVQAAINCPVAMVNSSTYCAIRCLTNIEIPNCEGYMRPVTIRAPRGSILNPNHPAACAARGVMGYRVFDAIMGAFAGIAPERVIAGGEGGPTLFAIGGHHEGRPFVLTEVMVGTWGARAQLDGVEGISNPAANLSNNPIELIEAELPLEVLEYSFVPDSGGAGRMRGGLAFVRVFRLLADEAVCTVRSDRRTHLPYGVNGGTPGSGSTNVLNPGTAGERVLPTMPMEAIKLRKGDVFRHVSAGGGGFGPACERDPALVLEDVREGKVTIEAARAFYGVAIDAKTLAVDRAGTAAARAELQRRAS
ncbi:MAG: hydantoinase B/oxoprolinase family protein [Gammaproteobacteria bacterium]